MTAVQDLLLSTFVIVVIVNILLGQEKRNRTEKGRDGKVYLLLFAAPPQSRRRIGDNGYDFVHVDGSQQQSAAIPHEYRVGHAESHDGQSHFYITVSSLDLFSHVITPSKNIIIIFPFFFYYKYFVSLFRAMSIQMIERLMLFLPPGNKKETI